MTTSPPAAGPVTAYAPRVGDALASLDTPSMVVDLDVMEANIAQLMGALLPRGVRVRPHLKTTKCAALARRLVAAGATGGCVAKLSEAEALAARGFTDLLVTCEVIGRPKVARLVALVRRHPGCLRVVVDSAEGAEAIDAALAAAEEQQQPAPPPLDVLLDLDVGLHRTGVAPGAPALALAARVAALPRLRLIGVQGYEGHLQHVASRAERRAACLAAMRTLTETAAALRAAGHAIGVVTTGGTGTAEFCAAVPGVTEVQPGSFIFMDTDYAAALRDPGEGEGAADRPPYRHALAVRATVLSRQGPRAATIDAGLKSLTTDSGLAACADARYRYAVLGDEHGSLAWDEGTPPLRVGDVVDMLPSHIDPTINLHDRYYAHRRGVLEEIWTVDARGMVQ